MRVDQDVRLAATLELGVSRLRATPEDLSRQLQEALRGRDVVAQARGALMERHGVAADTAYTMLRRSSRRTDTPLRRVAEDVMASTQAAPGVAASDDA